MRILMTIALMVSFSAYSQTRVRENIKQQSVSGAPEPVKIQPVQPVKPKK